MPKDVIVPAVFLNNIFQAHQVEIVMPRKQKPPRVPSPPLSPTSRALLESFGLQRVEPSADRMQIPAYLTPEAVDAASRALEAEAAEDRLLGLYAQFYASPQLLPALNEVLPAELHFAPYQDFLNAPAMQCSGATKRLQLSPPDARLLDDNVQRLLYRGFPPQPTAHPVRFCTSYARAACRGFRTAGPQHPRACKISQVSSAFDQEEYEQVAAQFGLSNQSRFTDEFKVEVSKKFLGLVKDGPNLYRFKNIMQEYENGSINQELLQFCFTMIFFGQLEAIYYFQLMQKNGILDPAATTSAGRRATPWTTKWAPSCTSSSAWRPTTSSACRSAAASSRSSTPRCSRSSARPMRPRSTSSAASRSSRATSRPSATRWRSRSSTRRLSSSRSPRHVRGWGERPGPHRAFQDALPAHQRPDPAQAAPQEGQHPAVCRGAAAVPE
uniref:Uncharacterized protein n=1 Tax=Spironucleus salmonicida TaxID=348837 RepID=V6LUS9_9EUKA|eukprot:EST48008.1 Hypothetical protein SS50377_11869 [Spironucleus salmonicida]